MGICITASQPYRAALGPESRRIEYVTRVTQKTVNRNERPRTNISRRPKSGITAKDKLWVHGSGSIQMKQKETHANINVSGKTHSSSYCRVRVVQWLASYNMTVYYDQQPLTCFGVCGRKAQFLF
jgi:hypothetical protein